MVVTIREYNFDNVGVETGTQPVSGTPSDSGDLITKGYADGSYTQGQTSVADTTALAAIAAADRANGDFVVVRATGRGYVFMSGASDTADGTRIVEPAAGSGRWYVTNYGLSPDTGDFEVDGDLTVTGDLTISGTTTTVNTATMEVEDANITVNKGGDEASADSAVSGLTVEMSDATDARIGFDSTLASKFKAGEVGSESEMITASPAQTITGVKTFDTEIVGAEISTPSNPSSGYNKLYFKSGGSLYKLNSGGVETEVGSGVGGGGGSGINYIDNPDAELDTTGWAAYADAAAATPADGTGGSPNVTWTRSTSSPLRGDASFLLTKDAADRQGEGAGYAFSIDSADVNKSLQISFDVDATDANYAANDLAVYVYDVTNAALITPASVNIAAAKYPFQTTFVATDSTSYRLIFHVTSTNASAYAVKFDNISVGPELAALGVSVVDFPTSAISASNFTNATGLTITGRCSGQRVGGNLHLRLTANFAGTGSDAADMLFDLSDFFGAITVASGVYEGGTARTDNATATSRAPFLVFAVGNGTTSNIGFAGSAAGSVLDGNTYGDSGSLTDQMDVSIILPINEWAGSAAYLNQAVPEYLANNNAGVTVATDYDTGFVYGPSGTPVLSVAGSGTGGQRTRYRCRSLTPIQDTDDLKLQLNDGNGWFNAENSPFSSQLIANFYYGMGIQRISGSTTDFYVTFGNRGADQTGVTLNAAGSAWSTLSAYRWRVVKIPGQVQATTFSLPAQMTNEQATAMGFKTYSHGTTYNGGNAPTITLSSGGGTLTSAVGRFIPYQVQDGSWRLKFNINAELSSTSRTSALFAIAGITTTSTAYAVSGINFALVSQYAYAPASNNVVNCTHSSTTTQFYEFSGDIPLASKPTWAY